MTLHLNSPNTQTHTPFTTDKKNFILSGEDLKFLSASTAGIVAIAGNTLAWNFWTPEDSVRIENESALLVYYLKTMFGQP